MHAVDAMRQLLLIVRSMHRCTVRGVIVSTTSQSVAIKFVTNFRLMTSRYIVVCSVATSQFVQGTHCNRYCIEHAFKRVRESDIHIHCNCCVAALSSVFLVLHQA